MSSEATTVDELDAVALSGVEGPLFDERGARDEVRMDWRQQADVGSVKSQLDINSCTDGIIKKDVLLMKVLCPKGHPYSNAYSLGNFEALLMK